MGDIAYVVLLLVLHVLVPAQSASPLPPTQVQTDTMIGGTAGATARYTVSNSTSGTVLNVSDGIQMTVQYAQIAVDSLARTGAPTFPATSFSDNLLLPTIISLGSGSFLVLQNVTVQIPCAQLLQIQNQACGQLADKDLIQLQVLPGTLSIKSMQLPNANLSNVVFTCQSLTSVAPAPPPPLPPDGNYIITNRPMVCCVAHAYTWPDVDYMSQSLQLSSAEVHVVVKTNVTLVAAENSTMTSVYNNSNLTVHGDPNSPITWFNLGVLFLKASWTLEGTNSHMKFSGITFVTLPLGPPEKYPWSLFGWAMWMVNMERCHNENNATQQLIVEDSVLVVSTDLMDYMVHWTNLASSPFPDIKQSASWYSVDKTCSPPISRGFLKDEVQLYSQRLWGAENATGFGVRFVRCNFTTTLPDGVQLQYPPLQLTQLFDDPYQRFDQIAWIQTNDELIQELVNGTMNNIMLIYNTSISPDMWPAEGITIPVSRPIVISGWPSRPTILDLQRVPDKIFLETPIWLRHIYVMNGAQNTDDPSVGWISNLTLLDWTFKFDRTKSMLQMKNTRVMLPHMEYKLLLDAASSASSMSSEPGGLFTPGSVWASTQILNQGAAHVDVLVEGGVLAYNVTLLDESYMSGLPFNTISAIISSPAVASPAPPAGHSATRVIVPVVVSVGAAVLLAAIALALVWRRRQNRQPGKTLPVWDATKPDEATDIHKPALLEDSETREIGQGRISCNGVEPGCVQVHMGSAEPMPKLHGLNSYDSPHAQLRGSSDTDYMWAEQTLPSSMMQPGQDSTRTLVSMMLSNEHGGAHSRSPARQRLPGTPLNSPAAGLLGTTNGVPLHQIMQGSSSHAAGHGSNSSSTNACTPSPSGPFDMRNHGNGQGFTAGAGAHSVPRPNSLFNQSNNKTNGLGLLGRQGTCHSPYAATSGTNQSSLSNDDCFDSFDVVPEHHEQLLINKMELSKELQASITAPDVASQLKSMVSAMQTELGDQEVEVTRVIGQGGGGVVYQGTWRGLTVAVKTLVFTVIPMQPMSRRQHRAMTEAAICKTLQHPNIVATYAYDLHALTPTPLQVNPIMERSSQETGSGGQSANHTMSNGSGGSASQPTGRSKPPPPSSSATEFKLYIIQEFCDGGTLKAAIDDGKLSDLSSGEARPAMGHILQLATDIAAGMSHVHSRNVVHGDLTPANVLLKTLPSSVSGWVAKVADFGLSWKLAQGQVHVSNARQGTSFYIAPEVLHVGIMSKAADVFSFGMLLHEMYHGQPYWRRSQNKHNKGGNREATARAAMHRPGLDQLTWAADVPTDFKELVSSCLSSDPQARPGFFTVVEQLLLMQKQLYAAEAASQQGEGAGNPLSSDLGSDSSTSQPLPSMTGLDQQSNGAGSRNTSSSSGWPAPRASNRQVTSGLLYEGDVKAMYRSMRLASGPLPWSSKEAPKPEEWEAGLEEVEETSSSKNSNSLSQRDSKPVHSDHSNSATF